MDSSADSVEPSYESDRSSQSDQSEPRDPGGDDPSDTPVGTTAQTPRWGRPLRHPGGDDRSDTPDGEVGLQDEPLCMAVTDPRDRPGAERGRAVRIVFQIR